MEVSRSDAPAAQVRPRAVYVRELRGVPVGAVPSEADRRDLVNLLERLAELSMHATGADRLSFFLLDDDEATLHLWGAVTARTPPEGLWDLSLSLPGIALSDRGRKLLEAGAPIAIDDAAASDLIPPAWVETFGLRSLVVAPLSYDDRRLGILVVDYQEPRSIEPAVIEMAGTVARTAAIAIATRGLADALSDEQERLRLLVAAGRTLASPRSLGEVAEQVADAIVQVLGARHLSVHLLDDTGRRYQTILQRGVALPVEGHLGAFPRWAVSRVADAWTEARTPQPVILPTLEAEVREEFAVPDEIGSVLVLPLFRTAGVIFGFVLVGSEGERPPSPAIVDLAATLAGHVGFSVDRALLDEQVAVAAEFARVLLVADDLEDAGPDDLVGTLHRAVPPALGFEVVGVRLHQEPARRDGRSASPFERRLWRNWRRRTTRPEPVEHDGFAYAPMWGGDRVGGLVKARVFVPPLAPHQRDLLDALAGAAGDVMQRRAMRDAMAARERELMLERERADVAADLQAAVGHVLATIAGVAGTFPQGLSRDEVLARSRRIAGLARAGLFGLEQAAGGGEALDVAGNGQGSFETALGQIVQRLGQRTGAAADLEVRGDARPLPTAVEQALIRVTHEALSRVGANGKASAVAVHLTFASSGVELSIRDDGADLVQRENGVVPAAHFGLRVMERRVGDLGGRLTVERSEPRGLLVRAEIPA